MLDHLSKKCFNAPEDISKACGDELRHKINEAADISASVASTPSKLSIPSSTPFIKRHFTPRLPKDDLHRYQDELTLPFIACNIPWSAMNNQRFWRAIEILRPDLDRLTSKRASKQVLNRLCELQDQDTAKFTYEAKYLTIVFDSLTGKTHKNVTNYLAINECRDSRLLDIVQGTPAKNAHESLEDINKFVNSLHLQESCKLFLCCDSAGVYYKVRSLLKSSSTSTFTIQLISERSYKK